MSSLVRVIKDSKIALKYLSGNCRKLLKKAEDSGSVSLLLDDKTVYAIERRLLEYFEKKPGWGFADDNDYVYKDAFESLREAFSYIIHRTSEEDSFVFNKRLNNLERLAKVTELKSYPIRCYYETTNRCNLRCEMCGQSFFKGARNTMPREAIDRLSPVFKWLEEISIFGYGEALLVDYIEELLDRIPERAASRLVTNGILLTKENNRMLVDHGLKILFISIDSVKEDTYKQIRGVDKLGEIKENIRDLVAYKKEKGVAYPEISLTFVSMKRNVDQLPDFIRMAHSLGVDSVIADYLTVFSENMREQSLFYDQERSDKYMAEATAVAEELGVKFVPPVSFSSKLEKAAHAARCHEPWEFIFFRNDGFLQPCCTDSDKVASWMEGDFWDYWNSEGLQEMRRTIHTPDESDWCKNCVHVRFRDIRQESSHIHIMEESKV